MKIFNLDLHVSVIADFKDVVREVRPDLEVTSWSLSGHTWVFGRKPDPVEVVNQSSWFHLTPALVAAFHSKYDGFLRQFDGFFTGHVTPFAMLFEKYGKPIFSWNTCRYDLPFCFTRDLASLEAYHACLRRLRERGLHVLVANNRGDRDYTHLGTGLLSDVLPSLCRYTEMCYAPSRKEFYWYSMPKLAPDHPLVVKRQDRYEWRDLPTYKAIIHVPYECSTMSLAEHFTAGIPLLIPTERLLRDWWRAGTHQFQSVAAYWGDNLPGYLKPCADPDFWLSRADWKDWIQYRWDNLEELTSLLSNFNDPLASARASQIQKHCTKTLDGWRKILDDHLPQRG